MACHRIKSLHQATFVTDAVRKVRVPVATRICLTVSGHWIHDCPNSNDTAGAHDKKRFVRVTGIPRSFLKHVETPVEGEGSSGGAMLTADGGFVRAVPDQAQFKKHVTAKTRALTGQDVRDAEPEDAELTCPICKKLLWDAVRVPCCDTAFCEECITNTLLERAFECPSCESKVPSLDKLRSDEALRERIKGYVDGEVERSRKDGVKEEGADVKEERVSTSTLKRARTDHSSMILAHHSHRRPLRAPSPVQLLLQAQQLLGYQGSISHPRSWSSCCSRKICRSTPRP